jgi:hypothetical protein
VVMALGHIMNIASRWPNFRFDKLACRTKTFRARKHQQKPLFTFVEGLETFPPIDFNSSVVGSDKTVFDLLFIFMTLNRLEHKVTCMWMLLTLNQVYLKVGGRLT